MNTAIAIIVIIIALAIKIFNKPHKLTDTENTDIEHNEEDTSSINLSKDYQNTTTSQPTFIPKPKKGKTKNINTIGQTTDKKAQNSPQNPSDDQEEEILDLRKAVIYSEILTPKFKKEDF